MSSRAGRWPAFETFVPGKWVLAGEHAVLRGAPAIALPHRDFGLGFRFIPDTQTPLTVSPPEARTTTLHLFERAWRLAQGPVERPTGEISIKSNIPIGAGFGSSAAFCVAIGRWLHEPLGHEATQFFDFVRSLEDHFHGRSSGLDVAVTSLATPIRFSQTEGPQALRLSRLPRFSFHDTGLRATTKSCVYYVDEFRRKYPDAGERLDRRMSQASREAEEGLLEYSDRSPTVGQLRIAGAMRAAQSCFEEWGICPEPLARQVRELEAQKGTLAAKITGAGMGGYVVVLPETGTIY